MASPLGDDVQHLIQITDSNVRHCEEAEKKVSPPAVQELVLARRHLEYARWRFKKAYALLPDDQKEVKTAS